MSKEPLRNYWLDRAYCVEATSPEEAKRIYMELKNRVPQSCVTIPYPANPRLGPQSDTPAFCMRPNECAGMGSCPREYACTE